MQLEKLSLLNERGWRCEVCGTEISNDYEAHHCLFHRMKGRPELDEKYNLMVVCKSCHGFANAYWVRELFWMKQVWRYGIVAMVNWYNRVRVADKPFFSKGSKGYSLHRAKNGILQIRWDSGEDPLIGTFSGEDEMERPLQPNDLIKSISRISAAPGDDIHDGIKGAIIGIIEGLLGTKQRRQILLFRLFPGKWADVKSVTTKDLLPGQWRALNRWISPAQYQQGDRTPWYGSADFVTEATLLMAERTYLEGQEHLDPARETMFMKHCAETYGQIPTMQCGHLATSLTALGTPFCAECADGGMNKQAYQLMADTPIMELKNVDTGEHSRTTLLG